jgi:hypothetical protein
MTAWLQDLGRKLFTHDVWNIGVAGHSLDRILRGEGLGEVRWWLDPGPRLFRADPTAVFDAGTGLAVLFEEFDYAVGKGEIRRAPLSGPAAWTSSGPELEAEHHLSYPTLVGDADVVWLIPEAHEAGGLRLYANEGGQWRLREVAMPEVKILDPTVVRHDGTWFLFHTVAGPTANSELHLAFAGALTGPWTSHPSSPMRKGPRGARPAGPLFEHGGVLHRPAQDCTGGYGRGIVVQAVDRLDRHSFVEHEAIALAPDPTGAYPKGLHTFTVAGDRVLVDGKRVARHASAWWYKLRSLWRVRHKRGMR